MSVKDPHTPLPPADKKPGEVAPQIPETDAPREDFIEGGLPGMPAATDPLLNPVPVPGERPCKPLD